MAELLAHVIAHEIGHVLLRTFDHAKSGLMSSHWSATEYSRMSAGHLLFTREQSREMIRNLAGDGCPQTSADRRSGEGQASLLRLERAGLFGRRIIAGVTRSKSSHSGASSTKRQWAPADDQA